jgi:DNA-3-methyladenine glycosylase II
MPDPSPATSPAPALDHRRLHAAAGELAARDPDLGGIVARHGPPPLWDREPGFATLTAIILEQQVSLASGAAALDRLRRAAGSLEPAAIAALGEDGARAAGQTRQKARYVVALAEAALDGRFDPGTIAAAGDDDARAQLVGLLGVGRWTADIYLLMALGRPDVWPDGDLALAASMRRAKRLATIPDAAAQRAIADTWRPWRAVAARLLWHAYLAGER